MTWTNPTSIKKQIQKLWDRGALLASLAGAEDHFPRRLTLKGPDSRELSERFSEAQEWISQLASSAGPYRIEYRSVNHRILGSNEIPSAIWIDKLDDALGFLGKRRAADQFASLVKMTRDKQPQLIPWLAKRPLRALELADDWSQLLAIVAWLLKHPRPSIYLRQIDLPGVHTKLIERHRGALMELLDLALPEESIDEAHTGVGGFCRRYGFLDKPLRVRFRILDPDVRLLPLEETVQDITLTQSAFASLDMPVSKVFITENEINFLAFPKVPEAIVLFGSGYGFENLAGARWLQEKAIYYWGDLDTHGFAILSQLRERLPHVESFLMDEQTLLTHRVLWGIETEPKTAPLKHLNSKENELYIQLQKNHWGEQVRLEQERISFMFLRENLNQL